MRCGRCGSENAEVHRFCGMCGAALVGDDQVAGQGHASVEVGGERAPAAVSASVKADAGSNSARAIPGASFLGLGTLAGGAGSGRGGAQGDHHSDGGHDALRPSSNVDYLLEDVEEPRRGWGKVILVVLALGLAVGFGYLHWKSGGFDWLSAGDKKPSAAQASDAGQSATDSAGKAIGTASGAATPAESGGAPATPSQTSSAAPSPSTANVPEQAAAPQSVEQQSGPDNSSAAASAPQGGDADSEKQPPAAEETPRPVHKPAAARAAAAKPAAAKPAAAKADVVAEAERYIYGQGAAQDCDRGLRLLKPAAEQSNVKAMVSLGVLYSTGTCTPRDLPTAYRWFALALHKEPDDQSLQNDLQNLWSTMTPPERQLAIKLSQ